MNRHTHLVASPIVGSIFGGVLALGAFPAFIFQLIAFLEGRDGGILPEAQEMDVVLFAADLFPDLCSADLESSRKLGAFPGRCGDG